MTLSLENLVAGYGRHSVIGPVSLSQAPGIAVLAGANGAGKSTLLRTIAGSQKPLGGSVMLDGTDVHRTSPRALARMLSLVFTDHTSAGDLTVEEVVALGRQPYTGILGRLGAEDRHVIDNALETIGIAAMRKRKLSTLSDGERQKTMIARALAQATPLMILDEPTSFLDAASRIEMMQLLRMLRDTHGKTIILSTHDIGAAYAVADNLWVIDRTKQALIAGPRDEVAATGVMDRVFESTAVRFDHTAGDYRFFGEAT